MVLARTLLGVLGLGFACAAVACVAAPDSAKKPLPICDAKDPECPGVPAASSPNRTRADSPSTPVPTPDPATDETDPAPAPPPAADAGVDAADAAPVVGQFCQKLAACCTELATAGYITTTCMSVLSTNNEDACYTQHARYKEYGDCS